MNISGIAVMTTPERVDAVRREIEALGWAEVPHWSADGRLVVVFEGEDSGEEISRFKHLKSLPGVVAADLVMHYCGEEYPAREMADADPAASGAEHTARVNTTTVAAASNPAEYLNSELGEAERPSYYQRLKRLGSH